MIRPDPVLENVDRGYRANQLLVVLFAAGVVIAAVYGFRSGRKLHSRIWKADIFALACVGLWVMQRWGLLKWLMKTLQSRPNS